MTASGRDPLGRLRDPQYTGQNRCLPCTLLNGCFALFLGLLVGLWSVPLGVASIVVSLGLIYARGYLIPGTPAITKRYLPEAILTRFHGPADTIQGDGQDFETLRRLAAERENAVDPGTFLREASVIEPTADGEEFRLTADFRSALDELIGAVAAVEERRRVVADIYGVRPATVGPLDRDYPAFEVEHRIRKWPSAAALVADLTAHAALLARTDAWAHVPVEQRSRILAELRSLRDACPGCGGSVEFSEDVVESCCGRHEVKTVSCTSCDQRLREFDHARVGDRAELTGLTP